MKFAETSANSPALYLTIPEIMVDQSRTLTQFTLALLASCFLLAGCQQPVTNGQARAGGPFGLGGPRLFANNNQNRPSGIFGGLAGTGNNGNTPGFGNFSGNNLFGFGQNQNQNQNPIQYPNSPINPFQNNQQVNPQNVASQFNQLNQQFNQRLTAYDTDNQLLNTELASLKQKLELSNQYGQTLKQQLADSATRAQQAEAARLAATQQLAQAQSQIEQLNQSIAANNSRPSNTQQVGFGGGTPAQLPGATLNANNSLARRIRDLEAIGLQPRLDGDVLRIEFPTDQFFVPNQMQIRPDQLPLLQNVVGTIRRSFPKQIIGIEAHWDNSPLNPATRSHHELTASQALTVFNRLVTMGLPANQMFAMAMGSNRPRYQPQRAGAISPNRRIELVIYPETYDRR